MAPPTDTFPASALPAKVNNLPNGKVRKPHERINLDECRLFELVQYECDLDGDRRDPNAVVKCWPIVRLFRRCRDGLTVETTGWDEELGK